MKKVEFLKSAKTRINSDSLYLKKQVKESKDFTEWNIKSLLPASKTAKDLQKMTRKDAENYLYARISKKSEKQLAEIENRYNEIMKAGEINKITISVEWKKSSTWGYNPTAEIRLYSSTGYEFLIGKASGCGYDKESAAIATALNQSNAVIKMLFDADKKDKDGKVYGYRQAEKGFFPHISGGVGTSCYNSVFALFGLNFEKVASGNTFDCYIITKK
jgi:hypothetical protein